jgi:hypothetical protein
LPQVGHGRQRLGQGRQRGEGRSAQLQKVYPGFTVQTWAGIHWTDDPTFNAQYARIVEGRLPEGVAKLGPAGQRYESKRSTEPCAIISAPSNG